MCQAVERKACSIIILLCLILLCRFILLHLANEFTQTSSLSCFQYGFKLHALSRLVQMCQIVHPSVCFNRAHLLVSLPLPWMCLTPALCGLAGRGRSGSTLLHFITRAFQSLLGDEVQDPGSPPPPLPPLPRPTCQIWFLPHINPSTGRRGRPPGVLLV